MQRKTSYYLKKSAAIVLAAAAGLVVGIHFEPNRSMTRNNADAYFVAQAYASDTVAPSAMPSPAVPCASDCADPDRECGEGIEDDCIYL